MLKLFYIFNQINAAFVKDFFNKNILKINQPHCCPQTFEP